MYKMRVGDYIRKSDITSEVMHEKIRDVVQAQGNKVGSTFGKWENRLKVGAVALKLDSEGDLIWTSSLDAKRVMPSELLGPDTEPKPDFDLKKEKWYIAVSNEAEARAAYEWIKAQGIDFENSDTPSLNRILSVATRFSHQLAGDILTYGVSFSPPRDFKEIKLTFKTTVTVESVQYPEPPKETIVIGGQKYIKEEVEAALKSLKPINEA